MYVHSSSFGASKTNNNELSSVGVPIFLGADAPRTSNESQPSVHLRSSDPDGPSLQTDHSLRFPSADPDGPNLQTDNSDRKVRDHGKGSI